MDITFFNLKTGESHILQMARAVNIDGVRIEPSVRECLSKYNELLRVYEI